MKRVIVGQAQGELARADQFVPVGLSGRTAAAVREHIAHEDEPGAFTFFVRK